MRLTYIFPSDEAFTPPPIQDEDFWKNHVAAVAFYTPPLVFRDDDVIVPLPPVEDEDVWFNPAAPIAATNFIALPYLPDPDELPAGGLIGVIPDDVQGVGQIEGVMGTGAALVPKVSGSGTISGIKGGGRID